MRARPGPPLLALAALFFVSGLSALVYQVVWQRLLALHSGAGIYSVALIVTAFMAGLGLGSLWGGRWSARLSARRAWRLFAGLELGIAAFGASSGWLYYDLLYGRVPWLYASPWGAGVAHLLALVLPTGLMGMSLPFLARATVRTREEAAHTLGLLYGLNVLGAAAGALLAPWVLMRWLGLYGALAVAATGNACAGLGAWALARGRDDDLPVEAGSEIAEVRAGQPQHPLSLWLALYALSGFCALSLEILWFRMVDVAVKSSAFTFGSVLAIYLLGSAVGALWGARWVGRLRRPLDAFLGCQCTLLALAALAVVILGRAPVSWLGPLPEYWARYEGLTLGRQAAGAGGLVVWLYGVLPAALYGVPTVLMGLSFPILQRAVQDDPRQAGRKVGLLQAANIAGCAAGSLAVGLWALDRLGTLHSLRLLLVPGVFFAFVGWRQRTARPVFTLAALLLAALALALPDERRFWARLHGAAPDLTLVAEDASGLVAIVPESASSAAACDRTEPRWRFSVNGKGNGVLPFGELHTQLGAVPALVHPAPRRVALVGLGSGATAWAAALRPETERVDVFEIVAPEAALLRGFLAHHRLPQLTGLLDDLRVRVHLADGRQALQHGSSSYDIVEADALRPHSAGAGNLYSLEFFQACARRLAPGGLVCTWAPTNRVYATFVQALPHVLALDEGRLLVGSPQPLPLDPPAWRARLADPRVAAYLGPRASEEVWRALRSAGGTRPKARRREDLNRDLYPRDELLVP